MKNKFKKMKKIFEQNPYKKIKKTSSIIKSSLQGAGETIKLKVETAKQNAKTKDMQTDLGIAKAKKEYSKKYNEEMTPSKRKLEFEGGVLSKKQKDYEKMRKQNIKKARKGIYK